MADKNILVGRDGHIAILTINHPPANAWNLETAREFENVLNEMDSDTSVRVVIVTGAGDKCFSAGFDVSDAANVDELSTLVQKLWLRIDRFEKPVIAAINGVALGGGCELAMACHFRFMVDAPKVTMGLTELNLGVIPAWGGTQRMARIIGKARALDLILFSKKVSANEALAIGLVNAVTTPEQLLDDCLLFACKLAERPPTAVACVLRAMSVGEYDGIEAGLQAESESAKVLRQSKDAIEGFTAFLEKRPPVFTGE